MNIEINDAQDIVLTKNGVVVGYVTIEQTETRVEFVGRPVYLDFWADTKLDISTSFASGLGIKAEFASEIDGADNFRAALKMSKKS